MKEELLINSPIFYSSEFDNLSINTQIIINTLQIPKKLNDIIIMTVKIYYIFALKFAIFFRYYKLAIFTFAVIVSVF